VYDNSTFDLFDLLTLADFCGVHGAYESKLLSGCKLFISAF